MAGQYHQFTEVGAEVIAIVNDSLERAQAFVERFPVPFPLLVDPEHRVYDGYQVESSPLSLGQWPGLFVIDLEGVVRYAHIGRQQWEIPTIATVLGLCRGLPSRAAGAEKG